MDLPAPIADAVGPLFKAYPVEQAMTALLVTHGSSADHQRLVEGVVAHPVIAASQALQAGLWLFIDDLERSHTISQGITSATGSFWHGIMHRREGDFSNSHYWFHRVGRHPAIDEIPGYDPHVFVDEVEKRHATDAEDLVKLQRTEWQALFEWCATNPQA